MSPPTARREAFRILRRVDEAGAFASVLLERSAAGRSDPREAALLTELVLGVLRQRAPLDHAIAAAASRPPAEIDPAVLTALRMGSYALLFLDRIPDFAAVDTAVTLVKEAGLVKAAGFTNGILRRIAREGRELLPPPPEPGDVDALALYRSHPVWWTRRLVDRVGWDRAGRLLAADNEPAATVLAPWPHAASKTSLTEAMASDGVALAPCRFVPGAFRVISGVPQHADAFRQGTCWVQDEASQLVVRMFGSAVGPLVLDACAAPGGKTLALAGRSVEGGLVVAADRNAKRLARVIQNASRVGAGHVVTVVADMSKPAPLSRAFDDVLLDAPCGGTGTLRRHPEIRWRLTPEDLLLLGKRQLALLSRVSELVRPGGRLVYSVCSLEPEEGERVVAAFLAERPEFASADPREGLGDAAHALVGDDLALRTSPEDDGMDGFFAALLTRRSN